MPAAPSPRPLPGDSHRASAASPRRPGLGPDGTWAGSLRGSGELGQRAKPAPPTASPRDEILAARLAAILSPGQTPRGTAQPRTPRTPRTPRDTGATPLHGPREASYTASSTPRGVPSLRIPLPHADDYDEERDGGDTRPPTSRRATPREQGGATPRHSGTAMTPRTPRTPQTAGGPPQTPRSAGPPQTPREPGAATPRGGPSTARPWEVGEKATARHLWEAKRSLCNPDSVHTLIAATPPRDSATPRGAPLQTCTSDAYGWGDAGGLGADRGGVIRMWRARGELTMQKPLVYKDSDEALRQAGQARVRHAKGKPAPADKPCISLPGKNATSFLREPFEAAEFSDQVLRRLRPQKGEALPSPRVRDLLPGWRKRNLNDGEFCKALVGVPGRPADVAHQSLDTLRFQAYHGGPVALNRTKGYAIDPGVVILPGTPRGRKVTDATDYSLEAYETHEGYEPEKPSTAEAKQRHDLLFRSANRPETRFP
ncbi:hypothetical protein T484DRAFT_2263104 [Baffinella frigidus]|nr:hypothetical protein T484DRAFT_2263104 [Cryptophyta sp. CCMP2293]